MPLPRPTPASPAPVTLSEKLLIAAGGWEAIRHARALRESGRVTGAQWSAPVLSGAVREGDREYRAGLKIISPTNVENLCSCRDSREWGTICAHSLAVGLAIVAGVEPAASPRPSATPPAATPPPPSLPFSSDSAAAARLHVILAPDLASAWAKGQLLVGLELAAPTGRAMLNAGAGPVRLVPEDFRLVAALAAIVKTVPGGMMFLDRSQFLQLLDSLADFSRLTLGRTGRLSIESSPLRPDLTALARTDGSLELRLGFPEGSRPLVADGRSWLLTSGAAGARLQPLAPGLPAAYQILFEEKSRRLPAEQAAAFLTGEWPRLATFFQLKQDGALPGSGSPPGLETFAPIAAVEPGTPQIALVLEGSLTQLGVRLTATYPNRRVIVIGVTPEREAFTYSPPEGPAGTRHTRNLAAERAALGRVRSWDFNGPDLSGHYFLRGEEAILRFFALGLPDWQKLPDWQVTMGSRFGQVARQIEIITPEIAMPRSGEDWFEMQLSLTGSSGERFPAADIQRLLQMGTGHSRLSNGKLAVLPADALRDLQEVLRDCDPRQTQPGVYRLNKSQGAYLEASRERWQVAAAPSWEQFRQRHAGWQAADDFKLPAGLDGVLRPYQQEGVRWLRLLAGNGLGGILADEMGLGKTLQALAYLTAAKAAAGGSFTPALVVCPTSLVDNWRREAAKFTPDLRALAIDGPDRGPLFARIEAHDLIVTSYALLRRDVDRYRNRDFSTVILDEAHQIKNPDSQVARAACALRSQHRFVLTGTPLENSVRDLWSILHFALPGYLGSRQDFRERYETPLARPADAGVAATRERLSRRLRPVLLRRRKADVAAELPERIEQTAYCDLTPAQAEIYGQLLEQSRLKLDDARRQKSPGAGRMLVLTALLRLRQACCDLRLLGLGEGANLPGQIGGEDGDAPAASSAKLALLDELLEEVREGGHRVLIFSQFVSMLKILSAHLEAAGTPFCYLDGSTKPKDRAAQVERFQADETQTAFLISVKAGGVGLNLTGADTVIHFDPWWNPAVEAQATDRAHRIGQTRVVTAYRLIARNTVEEKIFALQNRKKELTASLVEREKDEPLLETLSFAEIEGLLE